VSGPRGGTIYVTAVVSETFKTLAERGVELTLWFRWTASGAHR
jgi:hypothetical protein